MSVFVIFEVSCPVIWGLSSCQEQSLFAGDFSLCTEICVAEKFVVLF